MMRLHTLGQCVIEVNGNAIRPDAEVLFGCGLYLALERARRVERSELQSLFWPEMMDERGAHCLRQAIYRLREMGAPLEGDRTQIALPASKVALDFTPLLEVRDACEAREPRQLDALLALAAGEFLPGYAPDLSERFGEWLERQRDMVNGALRRLLVSGILTRRTAGDWRGVEALAHRCLALDPLNEEATLALAEAAAMDGNKARALAILDGYLHEIGPSAREIRLPVQLLRRRVAEAEAAPLRRSGVPNPPFVGRGAEMGTLHRALHGAIQAEGSGCLVWGESGIGKTRLASEFTRAAQLQRIQVVRVRCQSHDERRPMSAFAELVTQLLELPGALGCTPESMEYLNRLLRHDPTTPPPMDAQEAKAIFAQVRNSILDLLDAVAEERCTIILIEDVHWLDALSWELLADVVPWVETRRLMLMLTSRSADAAQRRGVLEVQGLREMPLHGLNAAAGAELLERVLAACEREMRSDFADWCLRASGGNPYFLFELALHALESADGYKLPPSLELLVAERLRRLCPASRRALQAIAVLGRHSTLERLEVVLSQRRVDLLDSLDELDGHGLLTTDGPLVLARHQLFADGAMERLSASSRAMLHHHAARLMEGEAAAGSAVVLWACAEHWHLAGETQRGLDFLRPCARHVMEMGAPLEAARTLEQAATIAPSRAVRIELQCDQGRALRLAGQWQQLGALLEGLHELRDEEDSTRERHTEEELWSLEVRWRLGEDLTGPLAHLEACASDPEAPAEHRLEAALFGVAISSNLCLCEPGVAIWRSVSRLLADPRFDEGKRKHIAMVYHASFGNVHEAAAIAGDVVAAARASRSAPRLARALVHAAVAYQHSGECDISVELAAESYRVAEQAGLGGSAYGAAQFLALHHIEWQGFDDARLWRDRAAKWADKIEDATAVSQIAAIDTRLAMGAQDWRRAIVLAREAAALWTVGYQPRRDAVMLADILLATVGAGQPPARDEIQRLRDLYTVTKDRQGMDIVVVALHKALTAVGEGADAALLAREYMELHRREAGVPPSAYRSVLVMTKSSHGTPSDTHPQGS